MKRFLPLLLAFCSSLASFGQDIIVIGQVVNSADLSPLESANVWFRATDIGTQTNAEGYFMLRAPEAQKVVMVSLVGYRPKMVKLDQSLRDQMITIELDEQVNMLDEMVVRPGDNAALPIMRRVREERHANNPDYFVGFDNEREQRSQLFFSNISEKMLQRQILRELREGALAETDSTLLLPAMQRVMLQNEQHTAAGVVRTTQDKRLDAIRFLPQEQLEAVINAYLPNINFYDNYVTILQKNFISPLAAQGALYYNYFLMDSVGGDTAKVYTIKFRPKNPKNPSFRGTMWIDAKSYALTAIEAAMPNTANINYLRQFTVAQRFAKLDSLRYYYAESDHAMNFDFHFTTPDTTRSYFQIVLHDKTLYSPPRLHGDSLHSRPPDTTVVLSNEEERYAVAIERLNETKIQRVAFALVDLVMHGYLHVWKLDVGPVVEIFRFNPLEGFRPTITLRTGEKLSKYFTVGGYVGYGFKDQAWKYGGEVQTRFGHERRHQLGLFYDNDVVRYGYQDAMLLNDNMVNTRENIFTSFSFVDYNRAFVQQQRASLRYRYEAGSFRLTSEVAVSESYPNSFVPFEQSGTAFNRMETASVTLGARYGFGQKSLDHFFHRFYLGTSLPIIHLQGTLGYYRLEEEASPYGKIGLTVKQNLPLSFGRFDYAVEGGIVLGKVPYLLLEMPYAKRGIWYNNYNFQTMTPTEFMVDRYLTANMTYYTNGWLFNRIPWVKRFNLRESLLCNVAYGALNNRHATVLNMPTVGDLRLPFVEAGFGVTNILRMLDIESIFRITHRNDPNAVLWMLSARIRLDF